MTIPSNVSLKRGVFSTSTLDTRVMKLFRRTLSSSFVGKSWSSLLEGLFKYVAGFTLENLLKSILLATAYE